MDIDPATGEIREWNDRFVRRVAGGVALGAAGILVAPVVAPALLVRTGRKAHHKVMSETVTSSLFGNSHTNPWEIAPNHMRRFGRLTRNLWEGNGKYASLGDVRRLGAIGTLGVGVVITAALHPVATVAAAIVPTAARANRYTYHNADDIRDIMAGGADTIADPSEDLGYRALSVPALAGLAAVTSPAFAALGAREFGRRPLRTSRRLLGGRADPVVPAHLRSPFGRYFTGEQAVEIARDPSKDRAQKARQIGALAVFMAAGLPYTATAVSARAARFAATHPITAGRNTVTAVRSGVEAVRNGIGAVRARIRPVPPPPPPPHP
jgi:hypothetical protein